MQSLSLASLTTLHIAFYGAVLALMGLGAGWAAAPFGSLLIWISVVDADRLEIPDPASVLLVLSGMAMLPTLPAAVIAERVVGGLLWPLLFWGVSALYLRFRGVPGLGLGDVKLMAGIGLWCGALGTIHVVLGAALSGMAVLALSALVRRQRIDAVGQTAVAFGPFLCLSAWALWLAGAHP